MTLNRRIKTKRKEGQNKVFEGTLKVFKGTKREERRKRDEFSLLLRKTADQIPWVFIFFAFWLFSSFFLRLWWSVVSIFFFFGAGGDKIFFLFFFSSFLRCYGYFCLRCVVVIFCLSFSSEVVSRELYISFFFWRRW